MRCRLSLTLKKKTHRHPNHESSGFPWKNCPIYTYVLSRLYSSHTSGQRPQFQPEVGEYIPADKPDRTKLEWTSIPDTTPVEIAVRLMRFMILDTYHRRRMYCSKIESQNPNCKVISWALFVLSFVHEPGECIILQYSIVTRMRWQRKNNKLTGFPGWSGPYFSIFLCRSSINGFRYFNPICIPRWTRVSLLPTILYYFFSPPLMWLISLC